MVCRLKALETEAYTQEEAERAAGMGSYIPPKHLGKVSTQTKEMDTGTWRSCQATKREWPTDRRKGGQVDGQGEEGEWKGERFVVGLMSQ